MGTPDLCSDEWQALREAVIRGPAIEEAMLLRALGEIAAALNTRTILAIAMTATTAPERLEASLRERPVVRPLEPRSFLGGGEKRLA